MKITSRQLYHLSLAPATGMWIAAAMLGYVLVSRASPATEVAAATEVAKLARDKDIVSLALTLTICMVGLVGFLIRMIFSRWDAAIAELGKMREELSRRPCVYRADKA
jgi:ABC-type thiamin/hydroxymethylpyrimidine transport system permease subunit